MNGMDPLLQYGPNDVSGPGPIQITIVVIIVLVGSWLFGAAVTLISKNNPSQKEEQGKEK